MQLNVEIKNLVITAFSPGAKCIKRVLSQSYDLSLHKIAYETLSIIYSSYSLQQVAQLSQRDRTAGWVSYGQN